MNSITEKNVPGAPFNIGDKVKVIKAADETCAVQFIGHQGVVSGFDYRGAVGQSYPGDPLVVVVIGHASSSFWKEELELVKEVS
ncbi:MAG: hypothetical protein WC279_14025 [Sulfurimonas sp.]|jgi:hypothetical protein|uniref:hypothetical protein n=1 Tax=Sulfurimonas sp. TaxID=2022749 RepID=UPI00356181E4